MLVSKQYGFRRGIPTQSAALKLTISLLKSINKKSMLEEFSVIWQRFFNV
jgi:hypothetical protein